MNKTYKLLLILAMVLLSAPIMRSDDGLYPKYEMRAAWMTTVSNMDFPRTGRGSSEAYAETQKKEIIRYLDTMKAAGLNCVFFHARPMADRLYAKNTWGDIVIDEPWSAFLTGTRGVAPAYDPLEFWIEEAHKRGMELHAWLNPYRYANTTAAGASDNSYNPYNTPEDNRTFESGWLIRHTASSNGTTYIVFNPAFERTTQRICDVCTVLANNYDLDGILFDDYFYPDGTSKTSSAPDYAQYQEYKNGGGTMSIADWRRDNVNRMVAAVYKACHDAKPWMRFGISPAGAAGKGLKTTDNLPALSQFCSASDWQYDGIASDPIAWLRNHDIDYISPQLYWKTNHATNPFGPMSKWWALVANKFGRHVFPSNNLDKVAVSPTASNYTGPEELCLQITLQRQAVEQYGGYPGIVFFCASYIDGYVPNDFQRNVKTENFSREALLPPMTWLPANNPGLVSNITLEDNVLSWDGYDNVRYTVYAVPQGMDVDSFDGDNRYLLGFTYESKYELPVDKRSGYRYAVAVYDRMGNEHSLRFMGAPEKTLDAPTLTTPAEGAYIDLPIQFEWTPVADAKNYNLEVARNADMSDFVTMASVPGTSATTADLPNLPSEQTLYWRVHACAPNYNDGISEIRSFKVRQVLISSPADGDADVALTPVIKWNHPLTDATLQLSSTGDFKSTANMVLETQVDGTQYTLPQYLLSGNAKYFCRLLYHQDGNDNVLESNVVCFTTQLATPTIPTIAYPADGGTLTSTEKIRISPVEGVRGLRLEVSASASMPARSSYITTAVSTADWCSPVQASDIKISSKNLVDGTTYYVRCKATFNSETGSSVDPGYSAVTSFKYVDTMGVDDLSSDSDNEPYVLYNLSGVKVATSQDEATDLAPGFYLKRTATRTTKIIVK